MEAFHCRCGNRLFFNNSICLNCGLDVGWCENCRKIINCENSGGGLRCGNPTCREPIVACQNRTIYAACNRYRLQSEITGDGLCKSCSLTELAPDLTLATNLTKWRLLEAAKRQLLAELDALNVPFEGQTPVKFHFLDDSRGKKIMTGHANGVITINVREADSVIREKTRVEFGEPHRTLIGHFRHEFGHYFHTYLIDDSSPKFIAQFGDPRSMPYTEALAKYHASGPPVNWQSQFITAYAAAHPWEDFAETFNYYLDMRAMLDTAQNTLSHDFRGDGDNVEKLLKNYHRLGVALNELNRVMGLTDAVPEVICPPVIQKLAYIHSMTQQFQHSSLAVPA